MATKTYIHEREGAFRADDSLKVGDAEALQSIMLAFMFLPTIQELESDLRK